MSTTNTKTITLTPSATAPGMIDITFRTKKAAHTWSREFGQHINRTGHVAFMVRRDMSNVFLGPKSTYTRYRVFCLEIPAELEQAAAEFFPAQVINQ